MYARPLETQIWKNCSYELTLCSIRAFKYQPNRRFLRGMSLRVWNIPPHCLGAGLAQSASTARSLNLRSSSVSFFITPTWSPNLVAITWSHSLCLLKRRSPWHLSPKNQRRRWWRRWSQKRVCLLCPLTQRRNPARKRNLSPPRQR